MWPRLSLLKPVLNNLELNILFSYFNLDFYEFGPEYGLDVVYMRIWCTTCHLFLLSDHTLSAHKCRVTTTHIQLGLRSIWTECVQLKVISLLKKWQYFLQLFLLYCIITVIKSPIVYEVVNNVVIEIDIHHINNHVIVQFIWRCEYMMSQRKHKH